jgi:hypothetical protein
MHRFVTTAIALAILVAPAGLAAQTPATCLSPSAEESVDSRHDFGIRLSLTDADAVADRTRLGLPTPPDSQVVLITDPAVCVLAGSAFYTAVGIAAEGSDEFIVLSVGNRRIVHLAKLRHNTVHVVFNDTFTQVITMFWH